MCLRALVLIALIILGGCAAPEAAATAVVAVPSATPAPTQTPAPTASPAPSATAVPPTATPAPPTDTPLPSYDLVLSGGALIDGTGAAPIANMAVAIRGGRIAAVARAGELAYSSDTPVRELAGATILPGFINAHVHTMNLSDEELRAWVRGGITTVYDLGGPLELNAERRDRIVGGDDRSLPRMLVTGPIINVQGSFSTQIRSDSDEVLVVDGPEDAREKVLGLLDGGADMIKIALSGRTDVNYLELSNAEVAAITAAAHSRGAQVVAHVDRAVALRRAVENGVDAVAHSPRDRIPDALIALMVARGVELSPTIAVYEGLARDRGNLPDWRRYIRPVMYDNLRRFAAAGGTLALGDDYGGARQMTVGMPADEIGHWLAAGLTPMEVIVAATAGSARVLGLEDEVGRIAPGFAADIFVVDGDPLEDIDALVRPLLVVHGGEEVWSATAR
jgi:imidazolonepropionase-like amidohydrolase